MKKFNSRRVDAILQSAFIFFFLKKFCFRTSLRNAKFSLGKNIFLGKKIHRYELWKYIQTLAITQIRIILLANFKGTFIFFILLNWNVTFIIENALDCLDFINSNIYFVPSLMFYITKNKSKLLQFLPKQITKKCPKIELGYQVT